MWRGGPACPPLFLFFTSVRFADRDQNHRYSLKPFLPHGIGNDLYWIIRVVIPSAEIYGLHAIQAAAT